MSESEPVHASMYVYAVGSAGSGTEAPAGGCGYAPLTFQHLNSMELAYMVGLHSR